MIRIPIDDLFLSSIERLESESSCSQMVNNESKDTP